MTTPQQPNGSPTPTWRQRLDSWSRRQETRLAGLETALRHLAQRLGDYRRLVALLGGLLLLTVVLLPWHTSWWGLPIVMALLVVPLLLVGLFLVLPTYLEEFVVQRGITAISATLTALLLVIAALWLVVNFFWAAQERMPVRRQETVTVAAQGQTVTVKMAADYPRVALMDKPGALLLRLESTAPLKAEVRLPPSLQQAPAGDAFPLTLTAARPLTTTIPLVNDGSLVGLRPGAEITLDFPGEDGDLALPLAIEGQRGYAIRSFVTQEVNKATPLLLLLALAVPGVAALVQRLVDRRYEELRQLRQKQYDFQCQQFSDNFCAGNWSGARAALEKLGEDRFRDFNTVDLLSFHTLTGLAELRFDDNGIVLCPGRTPDKPKPGVIREVGNRWPELYAAAYCAAWRKAQTAPAPDKAAYLQQLRWQMEELTLDDKAQHLQMQLNDVLSRQRALAYGERNWPPRPPDRTPDTPFATDDAADPVEASFLQRAYVPSGFYEALRRLDQSWAVFGVPGSGRTALGIYLLAKADSDVLGATLKDDPRETGEIMTALVEQLLNFVLDNRAALNSLSSDSNKLLARLLVQYLNPTTLLRQIDDVAAGADAGLTLDPLPRLRSAITQAQRQGSAPGEKVGDVAALMSVAQALYFTRLCVVVDGGAGSQSWLRELDSSGQLARWHKDGLRLVVLIPGSQAAEAGERLHPSYRLGIAELVWNQQDLNEVASERILAYQQNPTPTKEWRNLADIARAALAALDNSHQMTPRALIQLFRQMEARPAEIETSFTVNDVQSALEALGWGQASG